MNFIQFPQLVCGAVETGLNLLRSQSPENYVRQHQLKQKVIEIQLSQLDFPLYILFANQIQVYSHFDGDVAVKVYGDLTTLYRISEGSSLTELIKQDKLQLEGDLSSLQAFSQYLQQNPFDFPEFFSKYLGDVPTYILQQQFKQTISFAKNAYVNTQQHIKALATEEYKLAPSKMEYYLLVDNIDALIIDLERTEIRIQNLEKIGTT